MNEVFIKYFCRNDKNNIIFIDESDFYFSCIHFKLSSLFYSSQLIDIFAYEIPVNSNAISAKLNNSAVSNNLLISYNFHSLLFQQRFFVFVINNLKKNYNKRTLAVSGLNSIAELFLNAGWLERETAEMSGVFFSNKKDLRNLLLPYGDTTAPLRKSFPSIGVKEVFYDSTADLLLQAPVSIQF